MKLLASLALACVIPSGLAGADELASLRLDQIQLIGTHNSYHVAPDAVAAKIMRTFAPREAEANDYSHVTLSEQLARGLRQFEFDLFLDPKGDLYVNPLSLKAAEKQDPAAAKHDPDNKLARPGIKVLHSPDFDFRTTVYTLVDALKEVQAWSDEHRDHLPIFLLLELKSESFSPTRPPPWDVDALKSLEKEILNVLPRERILTPDDVRGDTSTLREAIASRGWTTVAESRGKFVLLLDNEGKVRDDYLKASDTLKGGLLFVSVPREHPAAAWMKRNDPVGSFDEIQQLVKAGFLVRTRADGGVRQARANDTRQRDKAFASGAQLISTDFPEADPRFPEYAVTFADGFVRANVVRGAK